MVNYQYSYETRLLRVSVQGIIYIKDIIGYYQKISEDKTLPQNLKVIIDCRKTIIKLDVEKNEMEETKEVVKLAMKSFVRIKEAIIIDNPSATVAATLFQIATETTKGYKFSLFNTEKAALKWLNNQ